MLYVIRHGQVDTNIRNQINGWNEEKLNDTGIKQAKEAAKQVKNLTLDMVLCSPLLRAKETLCLLEIKDVPVIFDDRLKERNSNSMVYKPVAILDKNLWYDKSREIIYEDTEGFKSLLDRTKLLIEEVKDKYKNKNVLFITHGDVCKAIRLYFYPDIEDISKFHQNNCEIIEYEI